MKGIYSAIHLTVHNISFKFCRWYDVSILCSYAVPKSCLILCDSMDCSMTFFPILHYLLEFLKFTSIESVMLFNYLILCCSLLLCLQSFPPSGSFPMSQLFISGGQNIGVSTLASVLPMNIHS